MADDEDQHTSDVNKEITDTETQEQRATSRYNLRPRQMAGEQPIGHQSSPLYQLVKRGELEKDSAALMAKLRKTLAATEAMLTFSSASVTTAPAGRTRWGLAEEDQIRGTRAQNLHGDDSPFEIVTLEARGGDDCRRCLSMADTTT